MRHYEKTILFTIAFTILIVCVFLSVRESSNTATLDITEATKKVEFSFALAFKEMKTYAKKRNRKLTASQCNQLAKNIVWYSQIYSELFAYKISPYLITCLIARESNCKNLNNSSKGYMAVNISTFKVFCKLYGFPCPKHGIGEYMVNNPEQTLEIGIIVYAYHLSKERGNIRRALTIYRYGDPEGNQDYAESIAKLYQNLTNRPLPKIAESVIIKE